MALRDPGAPRRNPFFAVDEPVAEPGRAHTDPDDDGWSDWADDPMFGRPDPGGAGDPLFGAPGSAVGPLLGALAEAGPEAAEHLVNAAHELTLAVKVVVDAFERTLAEQRAVFASEHPDDDADHEIDLDDPHDDPRARPEARPDPRPETRSGAGPRAPRVQNIDLE